MNEENRRSFVKKSLATSMTFTFSGLIRAHGNGENGETTTANPWGDTTFATTSPDTTETWATTIGTEETTSPWGEETTTQITTEETTAETTLPSKLEYFGYRVRVWPYSDGTTTVWTTNRNQVKNRVHPVDPPAVTIEVPPMAAGVQLTRDHGLDSFKETSESATGVRHISTLRTPIIDNIPGLGDVTSYEISVQFKYIFPSSP